MALPLDGTVPAGASPARPLDAEALALLNGIAPEHATQVRRLIRERDHLFLLHEALIEAEAATSLPQRLSIFVRAIRTIGFERVVITLRDEALEPTLRVCAGFTDDEEETLAEVAEPGSVWRRRFDDLERYRISQSYYLEGRDEWIGREFFPVRARRPERGFGAVDMLLVPLTGADGRLVATLMLTEPDDGRRPSLSRVRTVELFGQQIAQHIEADRLGELARRRAERLQRLQQVGSLLARSLDEREIMRELARAVGTMMACDGVVIARPDLESTSIEPIVRLLHGVERTARVVALGGGVLAEVARTGQPVLVPDYDPAVSPLAAADDVVGDSGPAGSVLAVPLLVGIRLMGVVAVHGEKRGEFDSEDVETLLTMCAQAASALSNARLYAESQAERRQSEALADVARAVSESLRMGEVMRLIMRHAMSLLGADGACVAMKSDDYLHIVAAGGHGELLSGMHLPVHGTISGRAVREGHAVISNDVPNDPELYRPTQRFVRITKIIVVPLRTARGVIGVLSVFNRRTEFTEADARVLQRLADHVAVAIVNARLYEELAEATREWTVAFDAIATGMVLLDESGRILRYNTRALQIAEFETQRELVGRQFYEAILHESREIGGRCPLDVALREGNVGRATIRSARRGKLFDVIASPHPNGGAIVTFDDVSAVHLLAERNRLVVETATDAIVVIDLDGRLSFANPAAHDLFARGAELLGTPMRELVLPDLVEEVESHAAATIDGSPQRYECVVVRGGGEQRMVSVSTAALRDVGQVTGIVAALRDMTDERRARDAVAQSEARYRNLFETASDAIFTLDAHGAFTSANHATCELAETAREELLGCPFFPFIDPSDVPAVSACFRDALAGHSRRFECTFVRVPGARRLLSVTNTPIRHGRTVVGVLVVARDITDERERMLALRHSEARYTNLVESASDAIFTIDDVGTFTSVNRALETATGRNRDDLLGKHFTTVVDPRDREAMTTLFADTLAGRRQRQEMRYVDANGTARPGSIITSPIVENGSVTGGLGVLRDVSEEKLLIEQLLQQEKLAAIGQLVSGVAHELNNPLASVMAFSQLLLGGLDEGPEEEGTALRTIHDEAKRAAKIVSNLLTFARQHPPQRATTNINEVLLSTLELRRYALTVHGVTLDMALADDVPLTWADPFQLQQVFLNLLANAEHALLKWGGERRIILSTERVGSSIVATVRDTGPGVDAAQVDRIFNPFYTTKPVGSGTGLGLSISDGIVREHGGRIRVESSRGKGAAFIVELPIIQPPRATRRTPAGDDDLSARPGPQSILVIDDEPAIRSAIARYLLGLGHRVDAVGTGAEALARLEAQRYDAILLDLRMPDMSGDHLYAELVAKDPEHAARTVFLTGDVQSTSARAFLESVGRPSLEKPFLFEDLTRVLFTGSGR